MKNILLLFVFLLTACGNPTPKVTPEFLSDAVVGYPYSGLIKISSGAIDRKTMDVVITPENSGLEWTPLIIYRKGYNEKVDKYEDFHNITIFGTPKKKGTIKIGVGGFTYGNMYPGKGFSKVYEIEVR